MNHATKYNWMYNEKVTVPILRTPVGGRRGYGPTHSQSLESLFMSPRFGYYRSINMPKSW